MSPPQSKTPPFAPVFKLTEANTGFDNDEEFQAAIDRTGIDKVRVVEAPPGRGKTRLIEDELVARGTWSIYAAPTLDLIKQTVRNARKKGLTEIVVIDKDHLYGRKSVGIALNDRELVRGAKNLFVTHAGLQMLPPDLTRGRHVFIDETPSFLRMELLSSLELTDLVAKGYVELSACVDRTGFQELAITGEGEGFLEGDQPLCKMTKSKKSFLREVMYGRLYYHASEQMVMCLAKPEALRAAERVTLFTADANTAFFPEWLLESRLGRVDITHTLGGPLSCPNAAIYYLYDRGQNMAARDFLVEKANEIAGTLWAARKDPSTCLFAAKGRDGGYLWSTHSKTYNKLRRTLTKVKRYYLSPVSSGMNHYDKTSMVIYLAATRLNPNEFRLMAAFFGERARDQKLLDRARHMSNLFQTVMRCALRRDNNAEAVIIVTTKAEALDLRGRLKALAEPRQLVLGSQGAAAS